MGVSDVALIGGGLEPPTTDAPHTQRLSSQQCPTSSLPGTYTKWWWHMMMMTKLRAADRGDVNDLLTRRSPEPVQHPHHWVSLLVGWHRGATEIHTPSVLWEKLELWVQGQTPVKWGQMVNRAHICNSEAQMHHQSSPCLTSPLSGMLDLVACMTLLSTKFMLKNEATELQNNAPWYLK